MLNRLSLCEASNPVSQPPEKKSQKKSITRPKLSDRRHPPAQQPHPSISLIPVPRLLPASSPPPPRLLLHCKKNMTAELLGHQLVLGSRPSNSLNSPPSCSGVPTSFHFSRRSGEMHESKDDPGLGSLFSLFLASSDHFRPCSFVMYWHWPRRPCPSAGRACTPAKPGGTVGTGGQAAAVAMAAICPATTTLASSCLAAAAHALAPVNSAAPVLVLKPRYHATSPNPFNFSCKTKLSC